jgi:hypothetical protein
MLVCAMTMGFVVKPHSFVDISICMDECAHAVGLVIFPHTFIA